MNCIPSRSSVRSWTVRAISSVVLLTIVASVAAADQRKWPPEWEAAFQTRCRHVIDLWNRTAQGKYGNTFFENEKRSYPLAMFALLAGHRESAVAFLQREDNLADVDNAHTLGIDFYPSFTLKGQVRKYFHFGDYLDPEYRQRMHRAATIWTERDPHHRPHPRYGGGRGGPGWRPEDRGGWVDCRSTDNLKAMRETSVYLFAEATGNEATRLLYKDRIKKHVAALYHVGMSEWDSENYLGHAIAPYLNLYDFAQDPEVRALAEAALDWYTCAGALKYHRGGFSGPTKRDYGGANVVFGANAARLLWPWFGETPEPDPESEPDTIHVVTSGYRPPRAIVALARKHFEKPATLYGTKPPYATFAPSETDAPMYWETLHFGPSFILGSVVAKQSQSDVGPLKLTVDHPRRGVDFFVANTAPADAEVTACSPGKHQGDQIAQHANLAIWLRKDDQPGRKFVFQVPRHAEVSTDEQPWTIRFERAAVAIVPWGLSSPTTKPVTGKRAERYGDECLLVCETVRPGCAGFALIVDEPVRGEAASSFRQRAAERFSWDFSPSAAARLEDAQRQTSLRMEYHDANDRPLVWRDGEQVDWDAQLDVYRPADQGPKLVRLGWKEGRLTVRAGDAVHRREVTADGRVIE